MRAPSSPSSEKDHPRIRGEHALTGPHTISPTRIIPAYAGSTQNYRIGLSGGADHPRIRGEHAPGRPGPRGRLGSSPHTRGAL